MTKNYMRKTESLIGTIVLATLMLLFNTNVTAQFSETFDNTSVPVGWSNTASNGSTSTNAKWKFSGNPGYAMGGTQDHTGNGGSYAWVDGSFPSGLTSILETDSITMTGVVNPELRFWIKSDIGTYSTTHNTFSVDIYDGSAWTTGAFTYAANTLNGDWEQFAVPLGGYTFTGKAVVRFNVGQFGSTAFYNDIALDDAEIVSVLANDAGLTAMLSPVLPGCTADSVVIVEMQNFGAANLTSAQVNWSINGALQMPYSWTGSLVQNGLDTITVGTNNAIAFGDTIEVWTSLPNGVSDSAAFNDSTNLEYIQGYSGVLVIDPAGGGDFLSFADAINNLNTYGVCGNLIVEAVDTTFIEQIDLLPFPGLTAQNSVTFRSQSGNRDACVITYSSTGSSDNYVVRNFGVPNVTFENMTIWNQGPTYAYGMHLWGANNMTVNNCVIKTHMNTSSLGRGIYAYYWNNGVQASMDNFTVTNCLFDGGYYNLYYYNSSQNRAKVAKIENNEFTNARYYGVYAYYVDDITIKNNYVTSATTNSFGYGMLLGQMTGGEISSNHVEGSSNWPRYGIYTTGVQGDLSKWFPVYNNRIFLPNPSADYGLYVSNCLFSEFTHNSVFMEGDNFARGCYATSGGYNRFFNNNIQVNAGGYGFYVNGSAVYESDHNNLSVPNGRTGYFGGDQNTLADWQLATSFDSNSVVVNNVYSDTARLKVCTDSLYGMGMTLPLYAMDYEGDMRQDPPCIGADEFMPISLFGTQGDPVLCAGDTLVLTQDYFDLVVWNTTDTSSSISITNPGSQSVAVYDECGSDTANFTVNPQQFASVSDTNLCEGTSAMLGTGISGGTYQWSNGSTDSTVMVDSAQNVSVIVVDMYGCLSADTAVVTQSYDVMLVDSTYFCEGANVVLDANMTGTYLWSDGSTNQTLSVNAAGSYSVTVTDQNCVSSATSSVDEVKNVVPAFSDSSSYLTVAFTNLTSGADSYLWDFGDNSTPSYNTDVNPVHVYAWTPDSVKLYTVTLTAYNVCGDDEYLEDNVRVGQMVSTSDIEVASMINVFPNPSNGLFNVAVQTESSVEMDVVVMDVRGAIVFNRSFGNVNGQVNQQVDISANAAGIYFVKVALNGESAVYRVIVE